MNPALLDSQLATLEPPANALHVINDRAPKIVVDGIVQQLAH
jgi:gluconokinase